MTFIKKIVPINLEVERKKFFFDPNYNPQFQYADAVMPEDLRRYGDVSDEYLSIAQKIIENAEKKNLSYAKIEDIEKEPFLSKEQVEKTISDYLNSEGLGKIITIRFSTSAVARTSMHHNVLYIRLPVEYTAQGLLGMLYHEIGTHQFRSMNDRRQIWRGKQDQIKLHPYYSTEEGLAVLHSQIPKDNKFLVYQSINYIAVHYANTHSFSETNEMLKAHVETRDRRFDICVRVKRGLKDTSKHGAFSKDQMYLKGAIEVWKWLNEHDFNPVDLYIGKVALEDVEHLRSLSNADPLLLPKFITIDSASYRKSIKEIGVLNFREH